MCKDTYIIMLRMVKIWGMTLVSSKNQMHKRKTKNSTNGERNWSELPQEILHLFSKKLPDISDFIRFRAVCKRWQLSAPITDTPPQLPWLVELGARKHCENAIIRFYCLLSGKVHTITCPGYRNASLQGPAYRYLVASHPNSLYLLNPLTNDQINVPFANVCMIPDYIGPDPIEGDDIVVMSGYSDIMAFWRPEADDWVYVERVGKWYFGNAYYMGQYFSNERESGITNVIDIDTKKVIYQVAPPEGINDLRLPPIMVESGGKILRLSQCCDYEGGKWLIYCLYFGDGQQKPCWVKITDIGDQILFLECHRGLSLCASNFPGFKENSIYFLKSWQYLCRYDIGNHTTEVLPCPFDFVGIWFVPSLV